jgi:hypothetical protein
MPVEKRQPTWPWCCLATNPDQHTALRQGALLIIDAALIVLTMQHSETAGAGRWSGSAVAAWQGGAWG